MEFRYKRYVKPHRMHPHKARAFLCRKKQNAFARIRMAFNRGPVNRYKARNIIIRKRREFGGYARRHFAGVARGIRLMRSVRRPGPTITVPARYLGNGGSFIHPSIIRRFSKKR